MGMGYLLSCLGGSHAAPPFVEPAEGTSVNLWTMSQRTGSVSYQTFGAGFSLAVYALFVVALRSGSPACGVVPDLRSERPRGLHRASHGRRGRRSRTRRANSPFWYVAAGFLLYFAICYLLIRLPGEGTSIFLRL